jgi:hypothetical protein
MFDFNFSTGRPTCFAADNQLKKSAGPRINGFLLAGILAALVISGAWIGRLHKASATIRLVSNPLLATYRAQGQLTSVTPSGVSSAA